MVEPYSRTTNSGSVFVDFLFEDFTNASSFIVSATHKALPRISYQSVLQFSTPYAPPSQRQNTT